MDELKDVVDDTTAEPVEYEAIEKVGYDELVEKAIKPKKPRKKKVKEPEEPKGIKLIDLIRGALWAKKAGDTRWGMSKHNKAKYYPSPTARRLAKRAERINRKPANQNSHQLDQKSMIPKAPKIKPKKKEVTTDAK